VEVLRYGEECFCSSHSYLSTFVWGTKNLKFENGEELEILLFVFEKFNLSMTICMQMSSNGRFSTNCFGTLGYITRELEECVIQSQKDVIALYME